MYKYLFGLIALILINACKHEFEQPSWTTHWTAPLAHSSLSINQLQKTALSLGTHWKTIVYS